MVAVTSPVLRHAITPAPLLLLCSASFRRTDGERYWQKSLCVSGGCWYHYRCRRGDVPLLMGITLFLHAISVLPEIRFQPRLWWCLIDRWSVPMLYNPAPTLFRLILRWPVCCLLPDTVMPR